MQRKSIVGGRKGLWIRPGEKEGEERSSRQCFEKIRSKKLRQQVPLVQAQAEGLSVEGV